MDTFLKATGLMTIVVIFCYWSISLFLPSNTLNMYRYDGNCLQEIELMNGEKYKTHYVPKQFSDGLIGFRLDGTKQEVFVREIKVNEVCK